jgi:8-oxo-dGTP pyrophosphatase MutT (NUDIX family)
MLQMYKVFFDNRTIYLVDRFDKYYKKNNGLFVKYLNEIQLAYVLELFKSVKEITNVFIVHHNVEKVFEEFSSFFRQVDAAGGLVKNADGEVLVIKRRGRWDLPKGKLEKNEDPRSGAIREVEEECSVSHLEINDLLHITYHAYLLEGVLVLKKTYWFEMINKGYNNLKPQKEEEITEAKWCSKDELNEVTQNTFKSIIDVLSEGDLFN